MSCRQTNDLPVCIVLMCTEYPVLWDIWECIHWFFSNEWNNIQEMLVLFDERNCMLQCNCWFILEEPTKLDARNIAALHIRVNNIPGIMGSCMLLKSTEKTAYHMEGTGPRSWEVCRNRIRSSCLSFKLLSKLLRNSDSWIITAFFGHYCYFYATLLWGHV